MAKPILVPHDGTEMSDRALDKAIEFARVLKSEIIIVHIVDSRFVPPSATLGLISEKTTLENAKTQLIRILKTGAEIMLKDRIQKAREGGVSARFLLGVGSPAEEIVSIANAEKAEMIIIGSRQLKATKMITLGSIARRVSETASCPVMIIR
ncbi:putative universal stress family protein [Candidatus Nitrososphaera gargensis Ga9.2]|uniref:Putative universal stress family protein n=1 Tax=Nitrososphaera gargensis (strain Ga9.2) TaxID=1237085 RepID=K0IC85_NITGG|nr:universal stress protein [Candidatus Nitrososphaera gargensis]AFU58976.1 putative universal stress family protein [Candidatus Nitrososphaera gargensis Ga9.2]